MRTISFSLAVLLLTASPVLAQTAAPDAFMPPPPKPKHTELQPQSPPPQQQTPQPQTQPSQTADDWNTTEITIVAKFPGPALWRVKKGSSEVYILGGLPVMEKRFDWDRGRITRILDSANVLLVSPTARAGLIGFTEWQFVKGAGVFSNAYAQMPVPMAAHFKAIATANGIDPKTYQHDNPVYAVMKLRDAVYEKHGLGTHDPEKMLIFMARDRKLPMKPIASYSAASLVGKMGGLSAQAKTQCVADTLDEIDFALGHATTASKAWAVADLNAARANSPNSATLACLEGADSTRALLDRTTQDAVKAVDDALAKPGKSVVVFPLSILLGSNGALDQLRAGGAEVTVPEM